MKRFIILMVFIALSVCMLSGYAMAYTDYVPFLSKGTTGASPSGSTKPYGTGSQHDVNQFGIGPREAPQGMPSTYDAYALGCFWCHGFEKRALPNNSNVVDLTRILSSPNLQALGVPAKGAVVSPLGGGNLTNNASDTAAVGEITIGNLFACGKGLTVSGARWTNMAMQVGQPYGPHGGYSNTTDRCKVCHDVHASAGNKRLTVGNTSEDICETCHDFTQGIGVYGAIQEATGVRPAGAHRVLNLWSSDQTTDTAPTPGYSGQPITNGSPGNNGSYITSGTVIPGYMPGLDNQVSGYPQTGGVYTYTSASMASKENQLTCTDCHTPHANSSMRPFIGDRVRFGSSILVAVAAMQPTHITWVDIPAGGVGSVAQVIYNMASGCNGTTKDSTLSDIFSSCGAQDLVLNASGPAPAQVVTMRINFNTVNGRAIMIRVLQILGRLPASQSLDANYWTAEGLIIDPNTSWGAQYASSDIAASVLGPGHHMTRIQNSGVALAMELFVYGLLDIKLSKHGISAAAVNRVASNKLLRDFVNGMDLRDPRFGGMAPINGPNGLAAGANTGTGASAYSNYDERLQAQTMLTNPDAASTPWNNGQGGALAVYGSAFCAACHRGRIGNYAGLANPDDNSPNGSRAASRLDADLKNIPVPPNAMSGYSVGVPYTDPAGNTVNTMTDRDSCLNHPTLMKLAYSGIGPLVPSSYPGGNRGGIAGSWGNPGIYSSLGNLGGNLLSGGRFGTLNGLPGVMERGLALSNKGFVMWPVPASPGLHPDGRIGESYTQRPKAPICQQCHEDSRDVEAGFAYMDTDRSVPYGTDVDGILGFRSQNGSPTMGDTRPSVNGGVDDSYGTVTNNVSGTMNGYPSPNPQVAQSTAAFLNDGNPAFQNFPHETQNYRLLVEGGDSNNAAGGQNDDLCLNCHVPGSTVRSGSSAVIFNNLVKDFNGFQE